MKAFDFEGDYRWLFCMTHPDDEIAICATIKRLTDLGKEVHLSWTHHLPVREQEARAVAHKLGVPQKNLYFLGSTDGSTCEELVTLLPKFKGMIDSSKPDRVVCGAFEQGHLDHDATIWLARQAFSGPIFEIPLYHTYRYPQLQRLNEFSDPSTGETLPLDQNEQRLKLEIAKNYPSQNIWQVLLTYEIVSRIMFRPANLRFRERMRLLETNDFRTPQHPTELADKVARHHRWERWLRALDAAEKGTL